MEFTSVIKNRYSCKKYDPARQVEPEKLITILEAGRLAPTAKNLQEQHIYVVQSEEGLAKIDEATPCRYGAPTVLVVAFDKNNVYTYPEDYRQSGEEDATIVATHMILAAANEGVDSCWLNFVYIEKLKASLGLPENEDIIMLMDLGYAAEGAGPLANHDSRKPLSETVTYM
ncbi:MAG: nitroreductase family protein [Dorea sp.]|nr:nitroreductase family protein [Dorea sp.]